VQEDQIVGVAGVFVLTFCLIALYHVISTLGRHSRRYGAQTKQVDGRDQDRRPNDLKKPSGKDDAWLLWR